MSNVRCRNLHCLELKVNDEPPHVAGVANAIMLSVDLAGFVGADVPAALRLAGMCKVGDDRDAHVYWFHELPLKSGDRVTFRLVDSEEPSPYTELQATDSAEYLEQQSKYLEAEAAYQPPTESAERRWPNLRIHLNVNGTASVRAGYADSEEHILCSLDWNQWRPEQLRVYVRSFSGASALLNRRETKWLRANLKKGESLSAELDT